MLRGPGRPVKEKSPPVASPAGPGYSEGSAAVTPAPGGCLMMPLRRPLYLLLVLCAAAWPGRLLGQGQDYVKANYTKYEYRIPMRDGKRLFTSVYVPKDDSKTYPILL